MRKTLKNCLAAVLALCLLLTASQAALAATWVADTEMLKTQYTRHFNTTVNAMKTEKPALRITHQNGVPEGGFTTGTDREQDAVDEAAARYLLPWIESIFDQDTSFAGALLQAIFGPLQGETSNVKNLTKGSDRNDLLPVYGENYVSALTCADDYDLIVDKDDMALFPAQLAVIFPDMTLEEAKNASVAKAFSLPTGSVNPTLIPGLDPTRFPLQDVHFTDFSIKNAKIVTKYALDGTIASYASMIDYQFQINFLDAMNIIGALLGANIYEIVISVMNIARASMDKELVSSEDLLRDKYIQITYRMITRIDELDFSERKFGDVDRDGDVTAGDARLALRHSVDLDPITNVYDLIYTDVNFDGSIDAADARTILRMSVDLDEVFTQVPEGKRIMIARVNGEDPPAEEPTEEDPTEELPSEEDPTAETPTEETPTEEAPSEEVPTEETPTEEEPTEEEPTEETDGGETQPTGEDELSDAVEAE